MQNNIIFHYRLSLSFSLPPFPYSPLFGGVHMCIFTFVNENKSKGIKFKPRTKYIINYVTRQGIKRFILCL